MPHPILPVRTTPPSPPLSESTETKLVGNASSQALPQVNGSGGQSQGRTMKAVMWQGNVGEMVCGSDLHTYHGLTGANDLPYIMGHEGVGIVSEVGKAVTDYKVGDRVLVFGLDVASSDFLIYGFGDLFGRDIGGCQAEYVLAPDSGILRHLPGGFDHELDYVLCSDIFATGWYSITQTGFEAGDVVAVYGAGPMGLLAAYSALLRGASKVYSIDRVASRLAKAKEIGAIPIDLSQGLPSAQILKLEPNGVQRVSDCCGFECVNVQGEPQEDFIINDAIALVATGGGIAITGVYWAANPGPGEPLISLARGRIQFDIAAWWAKNVSIRGGFVDLSVDPQLLALIQSGRAQPSFVFDTVVSIDEAPEAYRLFSERKIQKAAIRFFP